VYAYSDGTSCTLVSKAAAGWSSDASTSSIELGLHRMCSGLCERLLAGRKIREHCCIVGPRGSPSWSTSPEDEPAWAAGLSCTVS
jgi:hypothetical protein